MKTLPNKNPVLVLLHAGLITPTTQTGAGTGTYDDTSTLITYTGSWGSYALTGSYKNSDHYSYAVGSKASFLFHGERVTWVFPRASDRGYAEIYIDDIKVDEIGLFTASTYYQQAWTSPILVNANHTLRIVNMKGLVDVDAFIVNNQGTPTPGSNIAEAGKYDDTSAKITYAGTWTTSSRVGYYSTTLRGTDTVGGRAFITFTGERVSFIYTKYTYGGHAEIFIDDVKVDEISLLSSTLEFQRTWNSPPLVYGKHRLSIRNKDGVIYLDAIQVNAPAPVGTPTPVSTVAQAGTFDDRDAPIYYYGPWTDYSSSGPYEGSIHYTSTPYAYAAMTFLGTKIIFNYTASANRGHADIYIDGNLLTRLNMYSATTIWQSVWTSPPLAAGQHTIKVMCMDGIIDIDAFTVTANPTVTPTRTVTATRTATQQPTGTGTATATATITSTQTVQATPTMTATAVPAEPSPQPLQHAWYLYDGDGTMVKGIVNNTITYYPGRHYNKEVTGAITKVQKYYFAATLTLAVRTIVNNTDNLQWIISDHLGSASTTANLDGSWNSTIQYTAFGEIRLTQGVTPTKYRYTGQLAQAELGLDYYVARFYDPLTGHFTSADTIIPEPGKASAFDRYSYVRNNPLKYNDPYGKKWNCIGANQDHCSDDGVGLRSEMVDSRFDEIYVNIWDKNTKASDEIVKDIKEWEGYSEKPYDKDGAGNCTVGFGHKLHNGACSADELEKIYSEDEINTLFAFDIALSEKFVRSEFQGLDNHYRPDPLPNGNPFPITHEQYDALISFTMNAGPGNLDDLIMSIILTDNDIFTFNYQKFTRKMTEDFANAKGLISRRQDEVELFIIGVYPKKIFEEK